MSTKTWNNLTKLLKTFLSNHVDENSVDSVMESWPEQKQEVVKLLNSSTGSGQKRTKDPNAPKKGRSSYIMFCNSVRASVKEENPDMKATDITRRMGEMWQSLSDDQKKKYEKLALKDKERYANEMKDYVPSETDSPPSGGRKKKKERTGPKKALSSYMFYCQHVRPSLKEDNPDMKAVDITREMGRRWKALSDDEKKLFNDLAAQDKVRYENESSGGASSSAPAKKSGKADKTSKASKAEKPKKRGKSTAPPPTEDSDEEKSHKHSRKGKGKRAPTKKTGYLLFSQETRDSVQEANPKWKSSQVTKELARQWKELDSDEQEEYNDRANEEVEESE